VSHLRQDPIHQWPVSEAGLTRRVVRCLQNAGLTTIGQVRALDASQRRRIPRFGPAAARHIRWFFDWTERLETDRLLPADLRAWLDAFLTPVERVVVEQRYGLDDMLFRPQTKRRTFREIATTTGGGSPARIRQLFQRAIHKLQSRLARAAARLPLTACQQQIVAAGSVVTSAELAGWRGAPWLADYQPWGALLLWSETTGEITRRHDYFSTLPAAELERIEQRLFEAVARAKEPVSVENIAGEIAPRLARVLLDRHPQVDATRDGRFFLFPDGARPLLNDLCGEGDELAARYNALVVPHSRREPSELARLRKP